MERSVGKVAGGEVGAAPLHLDLGMITIGSATGIAHGRHCPLPSWPRNTAAASGKA